ncbi:zf-TFIIB domain-containing protein [Lysobacter korlensis]|uniref:Zf-TFIIB domain-containing protein n=1 Tax=Lysobacter korlensis TaxID=553636 RepID=A0ABV6RM04_9GAMM
MKCPKCDSQMKSLVHQGVEVDRCSGCAGLWFDTFEHEELRELSGSEKIDSPAKRKSANQLGPGVCPKDQQPLFRMLVAGQPHIAIESCGLCHGVFFDAGEFSDFKEETFGERLRAVFGRARAAAAEG